MGGRVTLSACTPYPQSGRQLKGKKEKHTSSYLYAANEVPNTLPVLAEGEPIASAFPLPVQFNPSWAQSNACGNCGGEEALYRTRQMWQS